MAPDRNNKERNNRGKPKVHRSGENKPLEAVMFIPYMQSSKCKRARQEAKDRLVAYSRVRYIENTGKTDSNLLVAVDPLAYKCGKSSCPPVHQAIKDNAPAKAWSQNWLQDLPGLRQKDFFY